MRWQFLINYEKKKKTTDLPAQAGEVIDTVEDTNMEPHHAQLDEIVEGPVIAVDKAAIYIDLKPFGTGIIYGREFIAARDLIRKTNIGDHCDIKAQVWWILLKMKTAMWSFH